MNQFKRTQVIILPTDRSNIVLINPKKEFIIGTETDKSILQGGKDWIYNSSVTDNSSIPQHLYIISDDEIKEVEATSWYINIHKNSVLSKGEDIVNPANWNKIIATTDASLIIGYTVDFNSKEVILPQPSQQFITKYIESYNKGEVITDVLVEYEEDEECPYCCGSGTTHGKQCHCVKLKVNPKDNTITIKKLKDSWNREEVVSLVTNALYQKGSWYQEEIDEYLSKVL